MRIGILGGSFHPFHKGHYQLGQFCIEHDLVDEVWFIPTGISYLKKNINMLSGEERLHLLELGISGNERMRALDIEIKRAGNTYTYETLETLNRMYPMHEFYFLIGADCLFTIETWVHAERIFAASHILVAQRGDQNRDSMSRKIKDLELKYHASVKIIDCPKMDISSTEIRERLRKGESVEEYLAPLEAEEIRARGYFLTKDTK